MRPIADVLYKQLISGIVAIERFPKGTARFILDKEYAIDLQFTLSTGMVITAQEKFREFDKWLAENNRPQYSDVTVELYNDPIQKIKGDWFNLASQVYFVGYASKDELSFDRYILLDWVQVIIETGKGNITWKTKDNQNGRARASFNYTSFKTLPICRSTFAIAQFVINITGFAYLVMNPD